ncbi:hypothetical protein Cgig2_025727 [Carnegiea gigantea]|uniref:Phosphotransferase n=1 Tax=Carnegiea gigantea TaxID=171969 RepID=A0A9Q1Q5W8_9CARY|nr:hypothetical protein Cgig2_025727 [Carnegiea gigantea]
MDMRSNATEILTKLKRECATPLPLLCQVADAMANDMRAGQPGLASDADGASHLKMILSCVTSLPTRDEKGLFYALVLGGTKFRVMRVQLGGKDQPVIAVESEQFCMPQELMLGTSEEPFDFIASRLAKFAEKEGIEFCLPEGRTRELGFTFSFPVKQTSMDSGSSSSGPRVNDTVGTLAGARYWDHDVVVAVILGTGGDSCYVERIDAIPKLRACNSQSGTTIINTEWGAFSTGLPPTEFDREMDAESTNPGERVFEKTTSGIYLGEIARRVLLRMAEARLFGGSIPEKLQTPFSLRSHHICTMQQDNSSGLEAVGSVLYDQAGVSPPQILKFSTKHDRYSSSQLHPMLICQVESDIKARKIVVEICDTIVKRGACLVGAGIVGILQTMEEDTKGVIVGPELSQNVVIELSKDGSGIGAALLAAANSKYRHST